MKNFFIMVFMIQNIHIISLLLLVVIDSDIVNQVICILH
jgi:hypothetical protein